MRLSYSKDPINPNLRDVSYADDDDWVAGLCPNPGDQCLADASNLIYDVYYPANYQHYGTCPLPAVILFHAGGFSDCTNLQLPVVVTVCEELAKRGFVAFSVEYRTGRTKDLTDGTFTSVQQELATYRACQDARGAIRSIIKRQMNEGTGDISDPYRINNDKIFVGGFSAGGLAAMSASWYTSSMVYSVFPNGGTGSSTIQQALGDIDYDFYYASSTDVPNFQSHIIGNACMWGAVQIPTSYDGHNYDFFSSSLLKPLISFQGKLDPIFPYDVNFKQDVYFPEPPVFGAIDYNSETRCINTANGPFFLDQIASTRDLLDGSTLNMRNILSHFGIANEHYVDCDMAHGFKGSGSTFHGDFGTGVTNSHDASVYLSQRIATFFQAVLNNIQGSVLANYFPDCPNTRVACNTNAVTCSACVTPP